MKIYPGKTTIYYRSINNVLFNMKWCRLSAVICTLKEPVDKFVYFILLVGAYINGHHGMQVLWNTKRVKIWILSSSDSEHSNQSFKCLIISPVIKS